MSLEWTNELHSYGQIPHDLVLLMTPEDAYKVLTNNPFAKQYMSGEFLEDMKSSLNSFKSNQDQNYPLKQKIEILVKNDETLGVGGILELEKRVLNAVNDCAVTKFTGGQRWMVYHIHGKCYCAIYKEQIDNTVIALLFISQSSKATEKIADEIFYNTPSDQIIRSVHWL